jgi:hypothetical protein
MNSIWFFLIDLKLLLPQQIKSTKIKIPNGQFGIKPMLISVIGASKVDNRAFSKEIAPMTSCGVSFLNLII